jgi:hypothetical protein
MQMAIRKGSAENPELSLASGVHVYTGFVPPGEVNSCEMRVSHQLHGWMP